MSERLNCINPACRCTVPKDKFPYCDEVVCGKCWKRVDPRLKMVHRALWREWRRWEKYELRDSGRYDFEAACQNIARRMAINWQRIRLQFEVKPEMPAGLEGFLKEMGFER